MDELKKLFESLEVDKEALDEVVKKAQTLVDARVKDQTETIREEIQNQVNEENEKWKEEQIQVFEEKYEEYKETMTSKFSEFVDHVISEEIKIPEKVREYARKGQIYEPIIEEFKSKIAVDQGLIDEEVKSLLSEARDKIVELQGKYDETFGESLELSERLRKAEVKAHLLEKCEELTLEQRKFMVRVLSDAESVEEVDEKFETILEQGYGVGGEKMEGKKTEGTVGPADDDAKKKSKGFETAKGTKKEKAKEPSDKSQSDDETMGSQGDKKLDPKKQASEDEDERGKGTINEEDDDLNESTDPRMAEWKRLSFKRN